MNYLDTVKFDEEKRKYVDAFGYVIEPLKNIRFTEKDNEELEESYPNFIQLKGMPSTYSYAAITTETSAGNDVSIVLDPKGPNGIVTSVSDFAAPIGKVNQVRLQSDDDTSSGIITAQGAGTNVHLDLRAKGAGGELKLHGDQTQYIAFSRGSASMRAVGPGTTDLGLLGQGSGAIISMRNSLAVGGLNVRTDYPTNTGVSLEAQSNNATCDIYIKPKSGIVNVPAPLFTTYGYMLRTHSAIQYVGSVVGGGIYVNFNTELQNTFGTGYWTSPDRFTNNSGVTMKVLIQCFAMTESWTTGQLCDMHLQVFNSGGSPIRGLGRYNVQLTNNSNRNNTLRSEAVVLLGPNESVLWYLYVSGGNIGLMHEAGTEGVVMSITQIP